MLKKKVGSFFFMWIVFSQGNDFFEGFGFCFVLQMFFSLRIYFFAYYFFFNFLSRFFLSFFKGFLFSERFNSKQRFFFFKKKLKKKRMF